MHRSLTAIFLGLLLLATAPNARADSLLSGYGGPGSGDQELLGGQLLGGGGGNGASGSDDGAQAAQSLRAAPQASVAPVPQGASTGTAPSARPVAPPSSASSSGSDRSSTATPTSPRSDRSGARTRVASAPAGRAPLTPTPVASPETTPGAQVSVGAIPLSAGDLLFGLALLVGLGSLAALTARAVRMGPEPA